MSAPALELRRLSVRYEAHGRAVISEVSLSVAHAEHVALLGLNGSGKTTLLSAAVGLVAHEGEVWVSGERLTRRTVARLREQVGFLFNVPEDQLLFPKVVEDVAFGLLRRGLRPAEAKDRARQALASLGVGHLAEGPLHHLSHGQKQRVALAGIFATEPRLLLLDEPSAGLDPPGKRALARLLADLDAAMVVATHDLELARLCCTRFLWLHEGRLVHDGTDLDEAARQWER